jgi:hypothetical protein
MHHIIIINLVWDNITSFQLCLALCLIVSVELVEEYFFLPLHKIVSVRATCPVVSETPAKKQMSDLEIISLR